VRQGPKQFKVVSLVLYIRIDIRFIILYSTSSPYHLTADECSSGNRLMTVIYRNDSVKSIARVQVSNLEQGENLGRNLASSYPVYSSPDSVA
jgi:hypothetical protein